MKLNWFGHNGSTKRQARMETGERSEKSCRIEMNTRGGMNAWPVSNIGRLKVKEKRNIDVYKRQLQDNSLTYC